MKLKKIMAILLALVLVSAMTLTGCSGGEPASSDPSGDQGETDAPDDPDAPVDDEEDVTEDAGVDDGKIHIEIVSKGFQHDFWQAVLLGTQQAAEEFGVTTNFIGPDTESDIADQVEMLNNAINKNPTAICLAALDTSAAQDAISAALVREIPIIGFDSGVPGAPEGAIYANASTNNYAAGELAATSMFEAIEDKVTDPAGTVRIGVVANDAVSESITNRTAGFIDKMRSLIGEDITGVEGHDKYNVAVDGAKVMIEVRIPAVTDDNSAKTEALTLLNKDDLIGIYGSNEFAAKAIINANEGLNKLGADKIIAVGFDSGALQLDAVRNGVFYGSITQDPVAIGFKSVELAVKAAKGEAVEDVDTGALWYNAENMDDDNIAPCLYE